MHRNPGLLSFPHRRQATDCHRNDMPECSVDFSFLNSREQSYYVELPAEANHCLVIINPDMQFRIKLERREAMEKLMRHRSKHKRSANSRHSETDLDLLRLSLGFT